MKVPEMFGSMVFNDKKMQERLPKSTYKALKKTIQDGKPLDISVANVVATAMKDWAIEMGCTHYTHWFQPMTGVTAEKHDSFIQPNGDGVIMEFSGKELIKGEPDASSFPSGGIRATFEARGYTTWDPTSPAFVRDGSLYIPTAFCSYTGEVLDKKTPLLRSMERISTEAVKLLHLLGRTDVTRVITTVGPEQEYFLIDRALYDKREDLKLTGRTLFGAIKTRVAAYMKELDEELWKLGVLAKTKHNEVAPSQHELAPIFTTSNIANDYNELTMEIMQKIAEKHGLVCLLHEKPFAGVNGSGKHNNWSIATDTGVNLLSPGESPYENAQFLLFLTAVIESVDEYADLLRASVATAGNDHRLGANEAPPAVVSVFLGDELTAVLEALETEKPYTGTEKSEMMLGVLTLPRFLRDTTDRNRTSPFAFTGNKFEFRMVGSSNSIACANIMLNAAVADTLGKFADRLEGAADFDSALHALLLESLKAHKRILFNGNGYDDAWIREAVEERGLHNLRTTPDAMKALLEPRSMEMLIRQKVYTETELRSRYEIMLENYCKTIEIEARTMSEMVSKEILPAVEKYTATVADAAAKKLKLVPGLGCSYEKHLVQKLSALTDGIEKGGMELDETLAALSTVTEITQLAEEIRDQLLPKMAELRAVADEAEVLTAKEFWPFPTYGEILF